MRQAKVGGWGICVSIAAAAAAVGGCSGSSASNGNQGSVVAAPGQNGAGTGSGGAPASAPAATPGSTLWDVIFGGTGSEQPVGITSDEQGNFYVAGSQSESTADPITGSTDNLFIIKYSPSGVLLWRQPIPSGAYPNQTTITGITLQPTTGALIIAGRFSGTVSVGGAPMTSGTHPALTAQSSPFSAQNVFLAAYDKAGYFVWSRGYTSTVNVYPSQVFVAGNGDIELQGAGDNDAMVGGGPLCCRAGDFNGPINYVARYSPKGDPIWSNVIAGEFFTEGAGIDADGGMVIGGEAHGTMTYQGESVSAGGTQPDGSLRDAGAVLRIDGQGRKLWLQTYSSAGSMRLAAALDPARNVVLYGTFGGSFAFGNGVSLTSAPNTFSTEPSAFLAKLGPDGMAEWAEQFPGIDFNRVFPDVIAFDAAGSIALAGETDGGLSVGGATLLPAGTRGEFVAKYGPDGSHLWSRGFPIEHGAGSFSKHAATFAPDGTLGVAGSFHNTVDFGTGPITVPGEHAEVRGSAPLPPDDMFVLKLAP